MIASPRFHTEPTPGARSLGPKVAAVGRALGRTPFEWQDRLNRVALELDDEGFFRYSTVLVSVPRQCGKTANAMSVGTTMTIIRPSSWHWYTAQSGQAARKRWLKECHQRVSMRLPGIAKFRLGAGDTTMRIPTTGSEFRPMPPTDKYLHGEQADSVFIDEAWVHSELAGRALEQAIEPTMQSRAAIAPGPQTWILSTMGTSESTWWHNKLAAAKEGSDPSTCVVDYGIGPDVDPADLKAVLAAHPLGHMPSIRKFIASKHQAADRPGEFARAFGNRATTSTERIIPIDAWTAAQSSTPIPPDAPVVFGAAIDIDRTETVIAAAALIGTTPAVEIVDRRPGTGWAADRIVELADRHHAPHPVIDGIGPSSTLAEQCSQLGVEPAPFSSRDLTRACADFMDRVTHLDTYGKNRPTIIIRPDDGLDRAADAVQRRHIGDAWAWKRDASTSIASLEAATLAVHGILHKPQPGLPPEIYFGADHAH